ncbi:hypothetical protein EDF24_2730 [Curtobacterium sp. PhB130]|uniref:hypothetical protein n=1 Tax=unclassified Curtobacterium TaxID=257496 RepID=UPI000F4BDDFA|nr:MULTISPECIES: hypothetical protein [unclassified Curtobacterium]ROP66222.1 hypothetical protein EDF55_0674 [Curtobacterium sp. ZW137]ROS73730.1 hypothetical protein EDF24_2730 [Curtobacterium sp. PhB130]TCK60321.1 hypothetical protein EDF27_3425 [Curtobacterium sp. PhB136]
MFATLLIVFAGLVAMCVVFAVTGARRAKALEGLDDPLAPRTGDDGAQGIRTAQAKAARPDGATGLGGFFGGP